MNKEDLRGGNVVEFRGGGLYLVGYCPKDRLLVSLFGGGYTEIEKYNDDLTNTEYKKADIVKVYKDYTCQELLWERKEKPKLTDDEKAILSNIDKCYKYIARDESNRLYIYKEKPYKNNIHWSSNDINDDFLDFYMFDNLFQFIKWEDEEPYLIEDLLEEQEDE